MDTGAADPGRRGAGSSLSYIPALDGIRGVAIIVIMGYHGGVFLTSGGFFSLDAFFALSGFLITSLLITGWQRSGTVRLRAFWARRARRLLPGLLLMLLGVSAYAAFLIPTGTYPTLRGDGIASLLYYANWHFIAAGSSYFHETGLTSPLTHMWSLAVEEQFYLLWPLVVLAVLRLSRRRWVLLGVCVAGALASAGEMAALYSPSEVNRLYYGTDTRAQSLLVGAALAVGLSLWADRRRAGAGEAARDRAHGGDPAWALRTVTGRSVALLVGLTGVAGSVVLWTTVSSNDEVAYRGGFLLAALATSAVLFSVVCVQRSLLARLLSLRPLRYVGRISYGMYLWHYPLFSYVDHARTGLIGYPLFAVRVAATLAAATVSYFVVERPVRQGRLTGGSIRLLTPAGVVATAAALLAATAAPTVAATGPGPAAPVHAGGPPVKVLVVGDSTALTLDIGLNEHATSYGVRPYNGGILGCGITTGAEFQLKGVDAPMATECVGSPPAFQWDSLWKLRISLVHPNVVMILAGRWEVSNRTYDGRWTDIEDPRYAAYVKSQLVHAVDVAGAGGAQVVLLTAPCDDSGEQPDGAPWPEDSARRLAIYNGLVRQVVQSIPGTSLLNFNAMACPGGHYEEYFHGQQVRESDGVHFTFTGGNVFAPEIWPQVVALGRAQMARTHQG